MDLDKLVGDAQAKADAQRQQEDEHAAWAAGIYRHAVQLAFEYHELCREVAARLVADRTPGCMVVNAPLRAWPVANHVLLDNGQLLRAVQSIAPSADDRSASTEVRQLVEKGLLHHGDVCYRIDDARDALTPTPPPSGPNSRPWWSFVDQDLRLECLPPGSSPDTAREWKVYWYDRSVWDNEVWRPLDEALAALLVR